MARNNGEEQERLYKIRHSAAHVMAQAVLELYPDAKIAIGPPIDTGFYYDFEFPEPVGEDDLPVPGVKWRITLPGGRQVEGLTNDEGIGRVEGFNPGSCEITFPELDQDFWQDA